MHLGVGSRFARVAMAVVTTVSITIVACGGPTPPPAGGEGPIFQIGSPLDGGLTAGTFFFSAQPLDASDVARVDFEVDGVAVGSDNDGADGFRVALSAGDYAAGAIELQATAVGTNGRSRTRTITIQNVPAPPSSTTVGSEGAVLATDRGSTLGIRPGDAVGANVSFTERTPAEVKAATGVDYAALGVTFLGAQEVDSDAPIEEPLMVSSADFASFVQDGQAIVNYRIAPDLDGDGIGELVVMNSASVAGEDVISDPVPVVQIGDATVTGQAGSALFRLQQQGIVGSPGDLVEVEASGFNPVASQSNLVEWTSQEDGSVVQGYATASADEPQILTFGIPVLPAGAATVTLTNLSSGQTLEPIAATILSVPSPTGSSEEIIDAFLAGSISFVQSLATESLETAAYKSDLLANLASLRQDFAIVFDDLAANPDADLEALFDQIALLFANSPILAGSGSALAGQALDKTAKSTLNWIKYGSAVGGFAIGAYFTVTGVACVAAAIVCGIGLGLAAAGLLIEGWLLVDSEQEDGKGPACPATGGGGSGSAPSTTGMGSAPPSGGSGCGSASGSGLPGSGLRSQQAGNAPILVKIFVGGDPLPFTGLVDAGGYFFIPIIPAGEPFLAVATDTGTNATRTVEGIGPALGDSVYLQFDFSSDEGSLPTFPLGSNLAVPLTPGDSALYAFVGSAGQLISLGAQGDPDFVNGFDATLFDLVGDTLIDRGNGKFYSESGVVELPVSGPYTLSVGTGDGSGTATVGVVEIDPPTPIDIGTSPATTTGEQTVLGDRHFFVFDAVAGDLHKFSLTLPAGSDFNALLNLRGPDPDPFYDGDDLLTPTVAVTASTSTGGVSVSDPFRVPATGSYVIEVERGNSSETIETSLGAWEFAVHTPDPPTPIAIGGTVMGSVGVPGEIDLYTFTGGAGQTIDVSTANLDLEVQQVNWSLTAPDGTVLFDEPLFIDPGNVVLPEAGTYTLLVGSDADDGSGAYEFTLANLP